MQPDQQLRKMTDLSKVTKRLNRSLVAAKKSLSVQRANSAVQRAALRKPLSRQHEQALQRLTASVELQKALLSKAKADILQLEQHTKQLEAQTQQQGKQLAQQRQLAQDCQNILAADETFVAAGLGRVLHLLAAAVSLGHLKPSSYIAQRLSTYGHNLCKNDTRGIRFSEHEMAFFSLLAKKSRSVLELLRGPVSAQGAPDDFSMGAAIMNDMVPSRQAIQHYDEKLAKVACIKPIGFSEAEVLRLVEFLPDSEEVELSCLAVDATDIAEEVSITLENEQFSCIGHHDVQTHTGTADPHQAEPSAQLCGTCLTPEAVPSSLSRRW